MMENRTGDARSIVVGTDFSLASNAAIAYAASVARYEELQLHIVFVRSFLPSEISDVGDVDDQTLNRQMLNLAAQSAIDPKRVLSHIVSGNPDREILRIATEEHSEYIVVGTHGKRGFDRLMLGSVAESLLREASVPVIVVGPNANANGEPQAPWKRILLACDLATAVSEAALLEGTLTVRKDAQLMIFNVRPEGIDLLPEDQFRFLESIMARESRLRLKPQCLVRGGDLATQVANMARDCNADLLVMSARASNRLIPRLHRSRMSEILCAAPCPVMVMRHKEGSAEPD